MSLVSLIGVFASVFTSLTLLPQLLKIIREKNAQGTSYLMLVVLFIGLSFWIAYGALKQDLIIIIANSFSQLVNLSTLLMTIIFRRRRKDRSSA